MTAPEMTAPLCLSHLALPARHPERLRQWYVDHLGCKAKGAQLWCNGSVITILAGSPISNTDWHFGFRLATPEHLKRWHERLQRRSLAPTELEDHGDYQTFSIKDIEGNVIEFFFEDEPA